MEDEDKPVSNFPNNIGSQMGHAIYAHKEFPHHPHALDIKGGFMDLDSLLLPFEHVHPRPNVFEKILRGTLRGSNVGDAPSLVTNYARQLFNDHARQPFSSHSLPMQLQNTDKRKVSLSPQKAIQYPASAVRNPADQAQSTQEKKRVHFGEPLVHRRSDGHGEGLNVS